MHDPNNSQDDSSEDEKILTHSFHKVIPTYSSIRNKPLSLPEAVMKTKQDKTEQYCELVWNNYKRNEVQVKWKLKNPRTTCWPKQMSLVPLVCFPNTKIRLESNICQLDGFDCGELSIKL